MSLDPIFGAVGLGGCLCGGLSYHAFSRLMSKPQQEAKMQVQQGSFASPSRWASPPTALVRASPKKGQAGSEIKGVSGDVTLTSRMADFSKLGDMRSELESKAYIELLGKLIGQSKNLQNNPLLGVKAEESRAAKLVIQELEMMSTKNGGPLVVEELEYSPGRSNVKITYPGTTENTVSFIGSHFDVVPADPETWTVDPFQLTVKGDKLYGRGTTDCLGHVALLTRFMYDLAVARPKLSRSVVVVFISAEEGGEMGVGVDMVVKNGKLEEAKKGPVYWVDCADSQPCCGSAGTMSWTLKCTGRLFHSGFPHKGINAIELASEVVAVIQERFYADFPPHPNEQKYAFTTGSTMKPTQISCAKGSFNQICPECSVSGDIRLSPFYDLVEVKSSVERYVEEMNDDIGQLPTRGPWSKFVLPRDVAVVQGEQRQGKLELKWHGDIAKFEMYEGIAVKLNTVGHKALVQACREVYAEAKPFSVSGSLPLVRTMQKGGFDIQLVGFGCMSVYHGVDEYCLLSHMNKAHEVLRRTMSLLETVEN